MRVSFTRETKPERNLLNSLESLSPSLTRHFSSTRTSRTARSGRDNLQRTSLPSPLLMRDGERERVKKSSSCHSLPHISQQKNSPLTPVCSTKSRVSARSPLALHGTSSTSLAQAATGEVQSKTGRKTQSLSSSPLRDSSTAKCMSSSPVSPLQERKRHLLERSLQLSPHTTATLNTTGTDTLINLQRLTRTSEDSLGSSHSSPTIILSSSTHSLHASRHSSPHSSSGELESGLCSRLEKLETKRDSCVLDLYLLSASTNFYQWLCTAWQDQKIVS